MHLSCAITIINALKRFIYGGGGGGGGGSASRTLCNNDLHKLKKTHEHYSQFPMDLFLFNYMKLCESKYMPFPSQATKI